MYFLVGQVRNLGPRILRTGLTEEFKNLVPPEIVRSACPAHKENYMKKVIVLLFAMALTLSMTALAQDAGSTDKKADAPKAEKAEKKEKKAKKEKKEKKEKKDDTKGGEMK
jgi:mannitol-specific phosphotransferase system IIBC component